jgi:cation:H+ antiporter
MNGSAQLAIGNAIGSVTANTTLIMGVSLVAMAGVISRKEFALKGGLLLGAVVGLTLLSLSGKLPVWSAFILWAIFLTFMVSNLLEGKKTAGSEVKGTFDKKEVPSKVLFFVLGTASIVFGAEFLVSSGKTLASSMGISEAIIGFTVIALGTSLPELVTAITSLIKGRGALSLGNLIGANLFNLVLVSGMAITITPFTVPSGMMIGNISASLIIDIPVMLSVMAILTIPAIVRGKLAKAQGFILLAIYAAFITLQFVL